MPSTHTPSIVSVNSQSDRIVASNDPYNSSSSTAYDAKLKEPSKPISLPPIMNLINRSTNPPRNLTEKGFSIVAPTPVSNNIHLEAQQSKTQHQFKSQEKIALLEQVIKFNPYKNRKDGWQKVKEGYLAWKNIYRPNYADPAEDYIKRKVQEILRLYLRLGKDSLKENGFHNKDSLEAKHFIELIDTCLTLKHNNSDTNAKDYDYDDDQDIDSDIDYSHKISPDANPHSDSTNMSSSATTTSSYFRDDQSEYKKRKLSPHIAASSLQNSSTLSQQPLSAQSQLSNTSSLNNVSRSPLQTDPAALKLYISTHQIINSSLPPYILQNQPGIIPNQLFNNQYSFKQPCQPDSQLNNHNEIREAPPSTMNGSYSKQPQVQPTIHMDHSLKELTVLEFLHIVNQSNHEFAITFSSHLSTTLAETLSHIISKAVKESINETSKNNLEIIKALKDS